MDNGPIARSHVFQQVMRYLGVEVRTHLPQSKTGRKAAARAKGKVERPFRTVKEMHETLYHFHEPTSEEEANAWLMRFLLRYNTMQHRSESLSRFEDWLRNLPASGIRETCDWERFCTFAREPERRKVGIDARVSVEGGAYAVSPELAGETVVLWWGIFDHELYMNTMNGDTVPIIPSVVPSHYIGIDASKRQRLRNEQSASRPWQVSSSCHVQPWMDRAPSRSLMSFLPSQPRRLSTLIHSRN
jgi:hypothetical protein